MHRGGLSWAELGFNCNEISRLVVPGAARNFNKVSIEFTLVAGGAGSRSLPMPLLVVLAMLVLVARGGAEAAERGSQGHAACSATLGRWQAALPHRWASLPITITRVACRLPASCSAGVAAAKGSCRCRLTTYGRWPRSAPITHVR